MNRDWSQGRVWRKYYLVSKIQASCWKLQAERLPSALLCSAMRWPSQSSKAHPAQLVGRGTLFLILVLVTMASVSWNQGFGSQSLFLGLLKQVLWPTESSSTIKAKDSESMLSHVVSPRFALPQLLSMLTTPEIAQNPLTSFSIKCISWSHLNISLNP